MLTFSIHHSDPSSLARTGTIHTQHGDIQTPAFITVGTSATVRAVSIEQLQRLPVQAILANTYHLYLQPGIDVVSAHGGFAPMMNWHGPTFTDSGGFQVFSLGTAFGQHVSKVSTGEVHETAQSNTKKLAWIDDNGVTFTDHRNGSKHRFTPESSMNIQWALGADIIFAFDECTSPTDSYDYQVEALARTHAWAQHCLVRHKELDVNNIQSLFAVVQGGAFEDLRIESALYLGAMDFDGYGIGGSFTKSDLQTAVCWATKNLPIEKPKHLLGIGEPIDLFLGIESGIDTFDCVSPTRVARHGGFYTRSGRTSISLASMKTDMGPLDPHCACHVCRTYTRSYIAHLHRAGEMLAASLLSEHNLFFILNIVDTIRAALPRGEYQNYKSDFLGKYYAKT